MPRKKVVKKETWKRNIAKTERYQSKKLPSVPACQHNEKKKKSYLCTSLSVQDVRRFHQSFYSTADKVTQDNFIWKHTGQKPPKQSKGLKKPAGVTITYYVTTKKRGLVKVCSNAFLGILGISNRRVQRICKKFVETGESPRERRGGDRVSIKYAEKKEAVKMFIGKLEFIESHYTREKSTRFYLPSDLTVRNLWTAYNEQATSANRVKYSYFLHIFNYCFNISFKSPATDQCSECIRLDSLLKVTPSGKEKETLMATKTVHRLKYKSFYDMVKANEASSVLKLSFDCQKNLVLPKVADQSAYYSRQLYLHNFAVCEGSSKGKGVQDPTNVFLYTWCEHERAKGSNEIASILWHHLKTRDLDGIDEIKLFCDGCPGQNKNMTVVGMLTKFLADTNSSIRLITITFPVVGHSFLPPDRVFGRIEKKIRKKEAIILPHEYLTIFSNFGTVRQVKNEVTVYEWKAAVSSALRTTSQLHFRFALSKRIMLKKTEVNYRSDLNQLKPLFKKGKGASSIVPEVLPYGVAVKDAKLLDVKNLLTKHFGNDWPENTDLAFYKNIISSNADVLLSDQVDREEFDPEFYTEAPELSV